jgi:hypothetical protein
LSPSVENALDLQATENQKIIESGRPPAAPGLLSTIDQNRLYAIHSADSFILIFGLENTGMRKTL